MEGTRPVRTQWAVMPQLPQRQQRVRSKVLPFQDKRSGWSTIAGYAQRTWCGNHVQAISLDERAPRPIVSPVVCSWSFRCAACLPLLSFFLFLLVRSARISCLSRTARGGVSRGAVGPQWRWPHGMGRVSTTGVNGPLRYIKGTKGAGAALRNCHCDWVFHESERPHSRQAHLSK